VTGALRYSKEPSVKYRGIFLNDEDWGLLPWAAKTYDPRYGNIGPKTYARLFEVLWRLKANTFWPSMSPPGKPACCCCHRWT
jgi:Glycosyl hydrolase family 115